MSRQRKEVLTSIHLMRAEITDKSSVEAFIPLLQTQVVTVGDLDLRRAELGEEGWQVLAGALRGKPEVFDWTDFSRENLEEAGDSIKDIWDTTRNGILVKDMHHGSCKTQRFTDQKLSSPIFTCCLFVRPASVT